MGKHLYLVQGFKRGLKTKPQIFDSARLAKEHAARLCETVDATIFWLQPMNAKEKTFHRRKPST